MRLWKSSLCVHEKAQQDELKCHMVLLTSIAKLANIDISILLPIKDTSSSGFVSDFYRDGVKFEVNG